MIATATDIRRFIGNRARPEAPIDAKIAGGIEVAKGTWKVVEENRVRADLAGKVPQWVPVVGGREFKISLSIELLDGTKARVGVSGSVSGTAEGDYRTSGDELRIANLDFGGHLSTISSVSLTRWRQVETRASFYRAPYTFFWFETWWVPSGTASASVEDFPPPRVGEDAEP